MDETTTTCARHPRTETRLFCAECGTPICPRCAVETVVGQKCPDCARQKRTAVRRGKPRQYVKGFGAGAGVAALGAFVLPALLSIPLVGFFVAFGIGVAVATVVIRASEGNRSATFRNGAVALAVLSMVLGYALVTPELVIQPFSVLGYLIAGFGAYSRYP